MLCAVKSARIHLHAKRTPPHPCTESTRLYCFISTFLHAHLANSIQFHARMENLLRVFIKRRWLYMQVDCEGIRVGMVCMLRKPLCMLPTFPESLATEIEEPSDYNIHSPDYTDY